MTKVMVLGPNGINDATFHVHAIGCRDINGPKYRWAEKDWTTEAANEKELIENLFSDFIGTDETWTETNGYTTWQDYRREAKIFTCVRFPFIKPEVKAPAPKVQPKKVAPQHNTKKEVRKMNKATKYVRKLVAGDMIVLDGKAYNVIRDAEVIKRRGRGRNIARIAIRLAHKPARGRAIVWDYDVDARIELVQFDYEYAA